MLFIVPADRISYASVMYEWLRVQLYNDNHSVLTLIIKYILVHLKMSMFLKRIAYTKIVCPYFFSNV